MANFFTRYLVIIVMLAVSVVACQPVLGATPTVTSTHTPSPTDTPTPTSTPTPTHTPTPMPTPIAFSVEELEELLLTLNDLEPGYTAKSDGTGTVTAQTFIDRNSPQVAEYLEGLEGWIMVEASFARETFPDFAAVYSRVAQFSSEEQAQDYFERYTSLYPEYTYEQVSFNPLAEQSIAYKSTLESGSFTYDKYDILIRQRNIVILLRLMAIKGLVNLDELVNYASLLEARLLEAVPSTN